MTKAGKMKDSGFWPLVLEGLVGVRRAADEGGRRVWEVTGWGNPVEEKIGFVEAACQNCEVLVEDKCVGQAGGADPHSGMRPGSGRTRMTLVPSAHQTKHRDSKDQGPVEGPEERILNNKVELSVREVLGIAKKEFHDSIVD